MYYYSLFFLYFLYLIQPLDINCFDILKQLYSRGFKDFIKAYINYIIKPEFFIAFKIVYFNIIISKNIKVGFRGVGLILYDFQAIILKLDIKLRISIPTGPFFFDADL